MINYDLTAHNLARKDLVATNGTVKLLLKMGIALRWPDRNDTKQSREDELVCDRRTGPSLNHVIYGAAEVLRQADSKTPLNLVASSWSLIL